RFPERDDHGSILTGAVAREAAGCRHGSNVPARREIGEGDPAVACDPEPGVFLSEESRLEGASRHTSEEVVSLYVKEAGAGGGDVDEGPSGERFDLVPGTETTCSLGARAPTAASVAPLREVRALSDPVQLEAGIQAERLILHHSPAWPPAHRVDARRSG